MYESLKRCCRHGQGLEEDPLFSTSRFREPQIQLVGLPQTNLRQTRLKARDYTPINSKPLIETILRNHDFSEVRATLQVVKGFLRSLQWEHRIDDGLDLMAIDRPD
jgi:hypothetical protein